MEPDTSNQPDAGAVWAFLTLLAVFGVLEFGVPLLVRGGVGRFACVLPALFSLPTRPSPGCGGARDAMICSILDLSSFCSVGRWARAARGGKRDATLLTSSSSDHHHPF